MDKETEKRLVETLQNIDKTLENMLVLFCRFADVAVAKAKLENSNREMKLCNELDLLNFLGINFEP